MTDASHRIVVGVDGSPVSIEAVRWAAKYAALTGAELEAVTSWTAPGAYGAGLGVGFEVARVDWQEIAKQTQESALSEALPQHDEDIRHTVAFDHPAAALLTAAEGAVLLVVGSRGHGGFTGMLLGSVSAHVVTHATCPVVVIRDATDQSNSTNDLVDRVHRPTATPLATPVHAGGAR